MNVSANCNYVVIFTDQLLIVEMGGRFVIEIFEAVRCVEHELKKYWETHSRSALPDPLKNQTPPQRLTDLHPNNQVLKFFNINKYVFEIKEATNFAVHHA